MDAHQRRLAARIAIYARWHGPDDPRVAEARRDLRYAQLAEHIDRLGHDLTDAQRAALAARLAGAA